MGTSKSYGGPADVSRLLPSWALPGGGDTGQDTPPSEGAALATPTPAAVAGSARAGAPGVVSARPWMAAKRSLGRAVRDGGGGGNYGRAASHYVRAAGGSGSAAVAAASGSASTARIADFLSRTASAGAAEAVRLLGLQPLAGRSADEVMAALTDALAPDGATLEEAAARSAVAETLAILYEQRGLEENGLDALASMTPDDIRLTVIDLVGSFVFHRWTQDLGVAIERKAVSAAQAVGIEREMRQYIREALKLDLKGRDVMKIDWPGPEGRLIVQAIFAEAYGFLEDIV